MKLICDLRDYRGDKEDLICVIDPKECICYSPENTQEEISLKNLLDGEQFAVYYHKDHDLNIDREVQK